MAWLEFHDCLYRVFVVAVTENPGIAVVSIVLLIEP